MYNKNNTVTKKIYIKNMLGKCCLRAVKRDFEDAGIKVSKIKDNFAEIQFDPDKISMKTVSDILSVSGLSLIKTREEKIIEELKKAVHELIHEMNNVDSIAKKSDYIVGKLGLNYRYLSKIFSN
ncbi:MAG: hypothetical protein GXO50_10290, partial [Chlorobi bacterium]|nr:hypothetical protein [Chlorobiota bacterium]